jgi:hypothetical protein
MLQLELAARAAAAYAGGVLVNIKQQLAHVCAALSPLCSGGAAFVVCVVELSPTGAALQAQAPQRMLRVQAYVTCKKCIVRVSAVFSTSRGCTARRMWRLAVVVAVASQQVAHTRSGMPGMDWYLPGMSCILPVLIANNNNNQSL